MTRSGTGKLNTSPRVLIGLAYCIPCWLDTMKPCWVWKLGFGIGHALESMLTNFQWSGLCLEMRGFVVRCSLLWLASLLLVGLNRDIFWPQTLRFLLPNVWKQCASVMDFKTFCLVLKATQFWSSRRGRVEEKLQRSELEFVVGTKAKVDDKSVCWQIEVEGR